jgi:hypothetical protein
MMTKTRVWGLAGLLCAGVSLQAATTLSITNDGTNGNAVISPYTGTLIEGSNTITGVKLFCDDALDYSPTAPSTAYNVVVSSITGSLSSTRFGSAAAAGTSSGITPSGFTMPTGTTLYDELAWIYTQMMATSVLSSQEALQVAAWSLTAPETNWLSPAKGVAGISGVDSAAQGWLTTLKGLTLTTMQVNGSGYTGVTFSNWDVIDDTSAAGKATGGGGPSCNTGAGCQEFLAYTGGTGIVTTNTAGTPEPATFGLFGSALLFGAMVARRRRASK